MMALGWGMAAAIGAVAGMLIAPVVFLEPNMMLGDPALRLCRRRCVGGLEVRSARSSAGSIVGVIENLAGTFIPYVGRELKLTIALAHHRRGARSEAERAVRPPRRHRV